MVVTLGQQYNVGEKPTVILPYTYYISRHVVSHIQRIGCQPEKTTTLIRSYKCDQPSFCLLNRKKSFITKSERIYMMD